MSFESLQLTDSGRAIIIKALAGEGTIEFTKIQIGNGDAPDSIGELTALQNPLQDIEILEMTTGDGMVTLNGWFDNTSITDSYYWTEIGVYVTDEDADGGEVLYAYAYAGDYAEYIPAYGGSNYLKTTLNVAVVVGDAESVSAKIGEYSGYADAEEFAAHVGDKNNPHAVTAEQVGLGNVPNVATDDQTPTYSVATTLEELVSGEKLSTAFGKIALAVKDLISHLADTTVHITSSERTTWNSKAAESHTHSATDITSGTLGLARGGTGATTAETAAHSLYSVYCGAVGTSYRITSGKDLDSYTTGGTYWCPSGTVAASLTNSPYDGANFTLVVFAPNSENTYQLLLPSKSGDAAMYFRSRNTGTWSDWKVVSGEFA